MTAAGLRFVVNNKYGFRMRLLGGHNVYKRRRHCDRPAVKIGYGEMASAIAAIEPQKGRLSAKARGGIDLIDDDL